jgi:hypothetical protein
MLGAVTVARGEAHARAINLEQRAEAPWRSHDIDPPQPDEEESVSAANRFLSSRSGRLADLVASHIAYIAA